MTLKEIFPELYLGEEVVGRRTVELTGLFVLAGLLEVWALRGAVKRDLALLAATLRADAIV